MAGCRGCLHEFQGTREKSERASTEATKQARKLGLALPVLGTVREMQGPLGKMGKFVDMDVAEMPTAPMAEDEAVKSTVSSRSRLGKAL